MSLSLFQVRVDMGEPILKASNVPTKLPANEGQSVVKSELTVDGVTWNVTCVSMGNPHCVTFGPKGSQVHSSIVFRFTAVRHILLEIPSNR